MTYFRIFHNKMNLWVSVFTFYMVGLIVFKEEEKVLIFCVIERKDVGGGENWGILEVTESKEGIFLNQIRRG